MSYSVRTADQASAQRIVEDWGSLNWLASAQIGNAEGVTVGRVTIAPGHSNPRHSHTTCEEVLYLLSGRLEHWIGDGSVILEAGDTLTVPAHVPHYATNVGDQDAAMIVAYSSGSRDFRPEPRPPGGSAIVARARVEDGAAILALQKLAYQSEAAIYGEYGIPPLVQSLEEMAEDLAHKVVLKAVLDGRIVGSVRAHVEEGTCYVGRLIVHPDVQNRGIGTRLLGEIERACDHAERYELFTGHKSERNLYLYRKLGYTPFKRQAITDALTLVFLEKRASRAQ
jgi:quercetin dioxygenase-like cupin family protein/GNAT superfamily N-acetyltransferase